MDGASAHGVRYAIDASEIEAYLAANCITVEPGPLGSTLTIPGHSPIFCPPKRRYEQSAALSVSFLIQKLRPKIFFDIGADKGYFSRVAASHIDASPVVHAFEARPTSLAAIKDGLERDNLAERVVVHATAISDRHVGERDIWFAGMKVFEHEPQAHEWQPPVWQRFVLALNRRSKELKKATVALTSIDHLAAEDGIVPDLIKIDVDGYEGRVLRGGLQTFASRRPVIALELHKDRKLRFGDTRRGVVEMMTGVGYRAFFLTDHHDPNACRVVQVGSDHPLVARQETDFLLLC